MQADGTGSTVQGAGQRRAADEVAGDEGFERARDGLRATGASAETRELVELIANHGAEEGALLATYEELASESPDDGVRYLVNLILEDERRHHRLLTDLSNAVAWSMLAEPPVATVPRLPRSIDGPLLEQTRRLLTSEREDFRALTKLRRRLRPYAGTTMWALVVDLMLLDTQKHALILEAIEQCGNGR
jgi:hypothetical protein